MQPFLRLTRFPYEEPYNLNLLVAASNGRVSMGLEIYCVASDLLRVAAVLRQFPKPERPGELASVVCWELGTEDPEQRWAFHLRLRLLQVSSIGECALEIRTHNNEAPPRREMTEFSIGALLPADLDRLAHLLDRFGQLEHRELEWRVAEGELR